MLCIDKRTDPDGKKLPPFIDTSNELHVRCLPFKVREEKIEKRYRIRRVNWATYLKENNRYTTLATNKILLKPTSQPTPKI